MNIELEKVKQKYQVGETDVKIYSSFLKTLNTSIKECLIILTMPTIISVAKKGAPTNNSNGIPTLKVCRIYSESSAGVVDQPLAYS